MTFLPIVVRELRVAARSGSLYRTRFWTALACFAYGVYLFVVFKPMFVFSPSGSGRFIFNALSYLGFFYCIALARNTADCVSREKREGTLGLLFLTDLKGYDVALGKLSANALKSFYGLLATVPVVCCAWVLGGVSAVELWRVVLALLNVFLFAQVAGLLVSTFSRDAGRATGGTALLLIVYFLGIPGLAALLKYQYNSGIAPVLELFDPRNAYRVAGAAGTRYGNYWISLLVVHLHAWLFLAVASLRLPGCWQDKPRNPNSTWRARFRQWCFGPPAYRKALRLELFDINPFLWLVSRERLGQAAVWGVLGLIGCGLVWAVSETGLRDSMPWFVGFVVVTHAVLKFWIASESCSHLEEQRRSGALEFLLSCTPLTVEEIIRGLWLALRRRFLGPMVAVFVFDTVLIVLSAIYAADNETEVIGYFITAGVAAMMMLATDAWAIGWLGMWRAMAEKRPRQAAGQTVIRILVLPWFMLFVAGASQMLQSFGAALSLWFVLGIGVDLAFAGVAKANLFEQFRARAAVQMEEPLGAFGQLGRMLGRMGR